ncbi:TM1812 family CRISPR-associated protein [Megasphaera sp. DISK 18]|uniref:TM1812 family CRISPR-associated protein n=1 Tax=Megasphaera sp. DISK 18 TaxID=1776081 RepID=UPI00080706E7|nr:TM1812 family CRISPR-associated protein [Megasphaera sp. DISK 18]OBZ32262.1 hypothetical protein A0U42_01935 [Megasphaera sp. DISK 18]
MKHIMLLFLNEVRLHYDRTLVVSRYENIDGTMSDCVQDNEAAIRRTAASLKRQGEQIDCLFYFSTKRTREAICCVDEAGNECSLTQEDLFRERIQSFVAQCIRVDCDELRQPENRVHQALEMAGAIRAFIEAKQWQSEGVQLHVDVTGPFRHTSMMLPVMQILKHDGIRTATVLDANRHKGQVEEVTDTYYLSGLLSGTDEFINFGSTRGIMACMEGAEQTRETKILLQQMHDFTNAVRICRTGQIAVLAQKFREALKDFEQAGAVSMQEKIFLRVLEVFKSEYNLLLRENMTQLDIIRWCVEKEYLQQALTLCSEWIPGDLVDRRIFYPIKKFIPNQCMREKLPHQTWQQYFVNDLTVRRTKEDSDAYLNRLFPRLEKKKRETRLRTIIADFEASGDVDYVLRRYPKEAVYFKALLEELRFVRQILSDLTTDKMTKEELKQKWPKIYAILHRMYHRVKNSPNFDLTLDEYLKNQRVSAMYNVLKTASYAFFQTLLPLPDEFLEHVPPSVGDVPGIYESEIAWNNRQVYYLRMMKYDYVGYKRPAKATLEILHDYFQLRIERNCINHAHDEGTLSTEGIKDLIFDLLRRMENISERESGELSDFDQLTE